MPEMNTMPTTPVFPSLAFLLRPLAAALPGMPPYECITKRTSLPLSIRDRMLSRTNVVSVMAVVFIGSWELIVGKVRGRVGYENLDSAVLSLSKHVAVWKAPGTRITVGLELEVEAIVMEDYQQSQILPGLLVERAFRFLEGPPRGPRNHE